MKHTGGHSLLSISDLADDELRELVHRSAHLATGAPDNTRPLSGRIIGIYFRKTSTRTRTAFSSAALRAGAQIIGYGPHDLQENTGETPRDTAAVLSRMLDALVIRTAGADSELREFASQPGMAVINAMSASEHPTQALADLATMEVRFGKVDGVRVLYVGEGNNTAAALALALSRFAGTELELRTPPGYGLDARVLRLAQSHARRKGAKVVELHDMTNLPEADVVYGTRWQTTGTAKADPEWRRAFTSFQVTDAVLEKTENAVFMHDLPAHRGEEVTAEVLDGPNCIAFEQAENKLHSARAVLEWSLGRS